MVMLVIITTIGIVLITFLDLCPGFPLPRMLSLGGGRRSSVLVQHVDGNDNAAAKYRSTSPYIIFTKLRRDVRFSQHQKLVCSKHTWEDFWLLLGWNVGLLEDREGGLMLGREWLGIFSNCVLNEKRSWPSCPDHHQAPSSLHLTVRSYSITMKPFLSVLNHSTFCLDQLWSYTFFFK